MVVVVVDDVVDVEEVIVVVDQVVEVTRNKNEFR
jgi:hypothetical protein